MTDSHRTCVILTGPTASGKTPFALALAHPLKGGLINADSMQIYDHLHILTARPSAEERRACNDYALDGVLSGHTKASTGWWVKEAAMTIESYFKRGLTPIVVGGTGLYLKSLVEGLSPVPDIPDDIRAFTRNLREIPFEVLKKDLAATFPYTDFYQDPQRLLRAYEVYLATGKHIKDFQGMKTPTVRCDFITIGLLPNRDALYKKINERFDMMTKQGALEEVEALLRMNLDPDHPILKATGVDAIKGYLSGHYNRQEMTEKGQQHTRQYAKRQVTWMKNQLVLDFMFDSFSITLEDMTTRLIEFLEARKTLKTTDNPVE